MRCRGSEVVGQIGAGSLNAGGERSLYVKMKHPHNGLQNLECKQYMLALNMICMKPHLNIQFAAFNLLQ